MRTAGKSFRSGTHRVRDPDATWEAFSPVMGRLGITRIADVTGLDRLGIPVFASVRPNARTVAVSQGKGLSKSAARASALMEAVELWHAENVQLPIVFESAQALLRRARIVPLERLPRRGVQPLDPAAPILWVEGRDLMNDCRVWVPHATVACSGLLERSPIFCEGSNGLASGNTAAEATLHALCELIERDATTLWSADPEDPTGKATQIALASVDYPEGRALIERIEAANVHVAIYDITSDTRIPAYGACISDRPDAARPVGYFWGWGCHLSPEVALCRALTEAAQVRLTEISGARDDIPERHYGLCRDVAELEEVAQMIKEPAPSLRFDVRSDLSTDHCEDDLGVVLTRLRAVGIQSAVAVELTRPDLGVPVVKVVATDLEPFSTHDEALVPGPRALRAASATGVEPGREG